MEARKRVQVKEQERRLLCAIADYWRNWGFAPSIRELCVSTGFTSTDNVHRWMALLRDGGYVTYLDGKARTVRLTDAGEAVVKGAA